MRSNANCSLIHEYQIIYDCAKMKTKRRKLMRSNKQRRLASEPIIDRLFEVTYSWAVKDDLMFDELNSVKP